VHALREKREREREKEKRGMKVTFNAFSSARGHNEYATCCVISYFFFNLGVVSCDAVTVCCHITTKVLSAFLRAREREQEIENESERERERERKREREKEKFPSYHPTALFSVYRGYGQFLNKFLETPFIFSFKKPIPSSAFLLLRRRERKR
jgi:hypothetical protein